MPAIEKITSIGYNKEKGTVSIHWDTGGQEGAVNGITFKVEEIEEHISTYKAPYIPYNPDYNEAF